MDKKIRVFDKTHNKMFYPDTFIIVSNKEALMLDPHIKENRYYKVEGDFVFMESLNHFDDYTKTEIYVDDVISCRTLAGTHVKGVVKYDSKDCAYKINGKFFGRDTEKKILGNIHENPELLESLE